MAETNALLKRHTGNCIEGSNPSVSAKTALFPRTVAIKREMRRCIAILPVGTSKLRAFQIRASSYRPMTTASIRDGEVERFLGIPYAAPPLAHIAL